MSAPVNALVSFDSHLSAEPPPAGLNSHPVLRCPPRARTQAGSGAALGDGVVGLAAALLRNPALGRQEVMPGRKKSRTRRPGRRSAAREVLPESPALTQMDAGAVFGWPVLQQRDPGRGVTLNRPRPRPSPHQQRLLVGAGAAQRQRAPSPRGTTLTTFHRSLTRESTLRMSDCSVPPLIPPADRGRCPQCLGPAPTCRLRPGPTFGLGRRTLCR